MAEDAGNPGDGGIQQILRSAARKPKPLNDNLMPSLHRLIRNSLIPSLPFIGVIGAWQAAVVTGEISPVLLPGPVRVWDTAIANSDALLAAEWSTLSEILIAAALATASGFITAMALSVLPVLRRATFPYMLMTQVVPKVALAPLLFAWFGIGFQSRLLLAVLIAYFPMVINTLDALLDTDKAMLAYSRSLLASEWQTLIKVRLPASLPATIGGVKITTSLAIVGIVVGEFIATDSGLGKIIIESTALMQTSQMIAATLTIAVIGLVLLGSIELLERRVIRWSIDR
jgi:NitT/TauT family transport system permease protein